VPIIGFVVRRREFRFRVRFCPDVGLGGFSCISVCAFFIPQGDNLAGFGRHDNEINARGREIKRTLTVSPCE
jgi:hypothetical protein